MLVRQGKQVRETDKLITQVVYRHLVNRKNPIFITKILKSKWFTFFLPNQNINSLNHPKETEGS